MLNCEVIKSTSANVATDTEVANNQNKIDLWHRRLAHVNIKQLRQLTKAADGIEIPLKGTQTFCEAWVRGKMYRLSHPPQKMIKSTQKLQLVYTDVCGPMQTQSFRGSRYFITFIDDYSRYSRMKHKSEKIQSYS